MELFSFSDEAPAARQAAPVLSVGQLTQRIRDALETGVGSVWVQGEVSNCRAQMSGHSYFTIKDATAQLSCVLFRGQAAQVRLAPADGLLLQIYGEISVYEARGQYQMIVKRIRAAGQGTLQARFEALKARLAAEGLFDADRKQEIPAFPATVAVVTSPTGSVIQDIIHVLSRRAPWLRVLVFPVKVQGAGAAEEIAEALRFLEEESGHSLPRIDTVVVARGGGSLEDLWPFNEEVTARAIADCSLPVISAVGHETDFTIADFVADLRAPTPSAAAELLAPDAAGIRRMLDQCGTSMERRMMETLTSARRHLDLASRPLLRDVERLLLPWRQLLDTAASDFSAQSSGLLASRRSRVEQAAARLDSSRPEEIIQRHRSRLEMNAERLRSRLTRHMESLRHRLAHHSQALQTLSPDAVLRRGYARISGSGGRTLTSSKGLKPGDPLEIHFHKSKVHATVTPAGAGEVP